MKNWHIAITFLIGALIVVVGALFKLKHWPGASITLTVGLSIQVLSGVLLVIKLFTQRKTNDFLNK
jgi:hypothetical protein